MAEVAAIGTGAFVGGFALAGARVYAADTADEARAAWTQLPNAVALVLLTGAAAEALADEREAAGAPLTVVLPP